MGKVVSQSFDQLTVYNDKIIPGSMGEKSPHKYSGTDVQVSLEGWGEAC